MVWKTNEQNQGGKISPGISHFGNGCHGSTLIVLGYQKEI